MKAEWCNQGQLCFVSPNAEMCGCWIFFSCYCFCDAKIRNGQGGGGWVMFCPGKNYQYVCIPPCLCGFCMYDCYVWEREKQTLKKEEKKIEIEIEIKKKKMDVRTEGKGVPSRRM